MQHKEFQWTTTDNIQIYAQEWQPVGVARGVIALAHGLGEHSGRYAHLARFFTQNGIAVVAYDRRGHGKSGGKRGFTPNYDAFVDEIESLVQHTKEHFPNTPTFLYGHSMGGNLVLRYLDKRKPQGLTGIIATGPAIRLAFEPSAVMILLGKITRNILPGFTQSSKLKTEDLSHDTQVVNDYINDPLVHDKITPNTGLGMLDAGRELYDKGITTDTPLLLMHGSDDHLTSAKGTEEFSKKVKGDMTLKLWNGLYHEIHNEPQKQEVFNFTLAWMEKQLG
jgi:alpha-beta hydrolase superfamily lysophospholipase